ncbi:MAG TPA: N-6 DNA methylase [Blastocatellia bacterium]|nr:N-6 DNA methylase [Blastocatellia bacterium]
MPRTRDEKHRYGQHYTPPDVARLLAAFAVSSSSDLIFDPSCGDGRLLREALTIKQRLSSRAARNTREEVFGLDRSQSAIALAASTGAHVATADFFDVEPGARVGKSVRLPPSFDSIIGNPPYIRQEVIGKRDKRRIEARLAKDRETSRGLFWPKWSGRSDIYVYFFAHAACFLNESGRLVFLTASSWLDVAYGRPLREFLLNNFRIIAIVESAAESFFADASINTAITVLERESDANARARNLVRFVRLNGQLSEIVGSALSGPKPKQVAGARALVKEIEDRNNAIATDRYRIRVVEQARLMVASCRAGPPWPPFAGKEETIERATSPGLPNRAGDEETTTKRSGRGGPPVQVSGWGKYLRADDVFFRVLERGRARLQPLSGLARVRFGVKTGANEFFYLTEDEENATGNRGSAVGASQKSTAKRQSGAMRALGSIASVRRGLTTGANEFFYLTPAAQSQSASARPQTAVRDSSGRTHVIESRFLAPVLFSLKEIPRITLEQVDSRRLVFYCTASRAKLAGTEALNYIQHGERAGHNQRPTCAAREPWYSVANGRKPAPLVFPSKIGERWLIALNRARVFEDKKLYGIFPAADVPEPVLAALLNSTWARYYAEITCRQMTGAQAIADIDVVIAEQIMIPDPRDLSPAMKKKLEAALMTLARRPVYSIFEEVKRADRRRLDTLTLEAIGIAESSERNELLEQLYAAATALVRARLSRVTSHAHS